MRKTRQFGSSFGSLMTDLVSEEAMRRADGSDMSESEAEDEVKSELQDAAEGLSRGVVNSLLRGDIDCPFTNREVFPTMEDTLNTFSRWAEIVESSQEELISAAENDGCDYSTDDEDASLTVYVNDEATDEHKDTSLRSELTATQREAATLRTAIADQIVKQKKRNGTLSTSEEDEREYLCGLPAEKLRAEYERVVSTDTELHTNGTGVYDKIDL